MDKTNRYLPIPQNEIDASQWSINSKSRILMKALKLFAVLASAFAIASCEPTVPGKTELGPLPTADYTMTYIDSNNIRLESQSSGEPFMFQWNVEGVGTFSGESC
jgi:hypothetical protein